MEPACLRHDTADRIVVPLLILQGTGDAIVAPAGATRVNERASSADKTPNTYDGLFHEVLNEPEQDLVIADILGWLKQRA